MAPSGYDPITLNHWLWYKYQCHERSPTDFQRLFEEIIKRARPEFIQIRPYGNIGDRKCDGLFHADGTVFQVYSPDDLKQAELQKKIKEDCDGAVKHWKKRSKSGCSSTTPAAVSRPTYRARSTSSARSTQS